MGANSSHILRLEEARRRLERSIETCASATTRLRRLVFMPVKLIVSKTLRILARIRGSAFQVRTHTFWGQRMTVVVPEPVSMNILEQGFIEEDLTKIMLELLRPGMVLLDVGAHFGYYSMLGSWLVGAKGKVVAFEPTPSSRKVLHANLDLLENASVQPFAVWSSCETRTFSDFGAEYSAFNSFFAPRLEEARPPAQTFVVETLTLDQYIQDSGVRPDVVKIDVESSEMEVLRGMASTLEDLRPAVTLEGGDAGVPGASTTGECVMYLRSLGYLPFEYADGALRPHEMRSSYSHLNLLFLPEEQAAKISAAPTLADERGLIGV